jgi:hypothetical protein
MAMGTQYLSVFIRKRHSVAANVVRLFGGLFLYSLLLFLGVHIEPSVPFLKEKKSYPRESNSIEMLIPQCHVYVVASFVLRFN